MDEKYLPGMGGTMFMKGGFPRAKLTHWIPDMLPPVISAHVEIELHHFW